MANECDNSVTIFAPQEYLQQLKNAADFDLSQSVSSDTFMQLLCPIDESDSSSRVKRWGTKWVQLLSVGEIINESLVMTFGSAWGPPLEAYESTRSRTDIFLKAYYNEFGMQFCGRWSTDSVNDHYSYSQGEDALSSIPEDIVETCGIRDWFDAMEEMED